MPEAALNTEVAIPDEAEPAKAIHVSRILPAFAGVPASARSLLELPKLEERAELRRFIREDAISCAVADHAVGSQHRFGRETFDDLVVPVIERAEHRAASLGIDLGDRERRYLRRIIIADLSRGLEENNGHSFDPELRSRILGETWDLISGPDGRAVTNGIREVDIAFASPDSVKGRLKSLVKNLLHAVDAPILEPFHALTASLWASWKGYQEDNLRQWTRVSTIPGDQYASRYWQIEDRAGIVIAPDLPWRARPSTLAAKSDRWYHDFYRLGAGETFVVVGAGLGEELLTGAKRVGAEGRILAVEAHPRTYGCLTKMCEANGFDAVIREQRAVGNREGFARIDDVPGDSAGNSIFGSAKARTSWTVPMSTVDTLITEHGFDRRPIDVLHMNIEGAEGPALAGMERTINLVRRACICAHDFRAERGDGEHMRTKARVVSFLRAHGFEIFTLDASSSPSLRDHVYAERVG